MILQNRNDPNTLYRMDLEYGKVVDEWKVDDNIPVTTFAPENVSVDVSQFWECYTETITPEICTNDW